MRIKSYYEGQVDKHNEIVDSLLQWINNNRSGIEIEDDIYIHRDHFDSDDLIKFIKEDAPWIMKS